MTSAQTGHEPSDDEVTSLHVDLDAEPQPGRDESLPPDHADGDRTAVLARWRWLTFLAVFLAGGLLGAYIANIRADTETANTVTARIGRFDIAPSSPAGLSPEEPVRTNVDILNTSDRDIVVTGASIPGMLNDGDHDLVEPREVAPGEWETVTVIDPVDCTARDLAPVATLDVTTSDGQQHQIEAIGPQPSAIELGRVLQVVCSSALRRGDQ